MQVRELLGQVPNLYFNSLTNSLWNLIIVNSYDQKFEAFDREKWRVGEIQLTDEFRGKMMKYKDDAISLLSDFDEELFHEFGSRYLKIIDFDLGKVFIFKIIE